MDANWEVVLSPVGALAVETPVCQVEVVERTICVAAGVEFVASGSGLVLRDTLHKSTTSRS